MRREMTEGDGSSARNFRSAYYEKLGFCDNDEKNYLEILIEASPFDDDKLNDLSERPELDRKCIEAWKILLGVECDRKNPFDDYANVRRVRSEHFHLLKHHLEVLLKHNLFMNKSRSACLTRNNDRNQANTGGNRPKRAHQNVCMELDQNRHQEYPSERDHRDQHHNDHHNHHHHLKHEQQQQQTQHHENNHKTQASAGHAKLIAMMYLLETGRLDTLDMDGQLKTDECRKLLSTATFFVNVASDLQEAFFLFRNFTNRIQNKVSSSASGGGGVAL